MSITRTLAATLATAALAAAAAHAQPADMHASVAQAAAKAQQKQDLRHLRAGGAATKREQDARPHQENVGAYTPGAIPAVSYPSGGAYTPGAVPAVSYPRPVVAAHAVQAPDNSDGVSATTIGLGIAGSLLAISAIAGMMKRSRRTGRARVAA